MSEEAIHLEVLPPENRPDPFVPVKLKPAQTLPNLWWKWQETKEPMRPSTRNEYYVAGRLFTKFFRDKKLSPQEFLNWMEYMKARKSHIRGTVQPQTTNKLNSKVRGFLRWLYTMKFTAYDLSQCVPALRAPATKQPIAITEEQYQAIKTWCHGRQWCQPHLWLIILAYRTGMSLVDCCYLRWKDVHLDDNGPSYISIIRQKMATRSGERARCQIPIIPGTDLHEWILERKQVVNYKRFDGINDYVHQDCPGLYQWVGAFDGLHEEMRRIFKSVGIPKGTTFKNLRNSLLSNLVNSGMNLALVCKITGHTNPQILMTYLKPDRMALQDGMAKAHAYSAAQIKPTNGITLHETTENIDGQRTAEEDHGGDKNP